MRRMQVEIEVGGITASAQRLAELAKQIRTTGKAAELLKTGTPQAGTALPATRKINAGPYQRLVKAQEQLHEALQRGTLAEISDAQLALERAKAQVEKLTAAPVVPPAPVNVTRTLTLKPLKIAGPYERLAKAQEQLQEALLRGTARQQQDAQTAVNQAQALVSRLSAPARFTLPAGPYQRLQRAQAALADALQQGTAAQIADARNAVDQAQKRVDALYQNSLGKTIKLPPVKPTKPFSVAGPSQRLQKAQDALQKALTQGTASQIHDAELALTKARERLTRANRPAPRSTLGGRLAEALLSTRINLPGVGGIGASPLVGRTLAALGATGGVALAISGAALAAAAFAAAVREGTESLKQLSAAGAISGGTAGEVGGLRAVGISSGSIAALAASVRQARSSDPFAASAFGFQLPRPFGSVDEAKGLQEVIQKLAGVDAKGKKLAADLDKFASAEQRLSAARKIGLDSLIPTIEAIRRMPALYAADLAARKKIFTPEAAQQAQDFAYQSDRASSNVDLLNQALAKAWMPAATEMLKGTANFERSLAKFFNAHPNWMEQLGRMMAGMPYQKLPPAGVTSPPADPAVQASKANTDALKDLSGILKGGTYGGGDRARGVFPSHLVPAAADAKMNGDAIRLGFWGI